MSMNATKAFMQGGLNILQNLNIFNRVSKNLSIAMLLIFVVLVGIIFYLNTSMYQRYISQVFIKAHVLTLVQSKAKQVVQMPTGEAYPVYSAQIIKAPMVLNIIEELKQALIMSVVEALLATVVTLIVIVKYMQNRGEEQNKTKIIRGSEELVDGEQLKKQIKKSGKVSPYSICGVPLPLGSERQHIQIVGTTGGGKTMAICELLTTIRARGERAIVYDKGGTYLSRFYREGQDIILNPLDNRGRAWNVWAECEDKADLEALAEAIMPMPLNSAMDPFWIHAARMIFVSTAYQLRTHPKRSNTMLLQYLLTSDLGRIHHLLRHTEAESLVSEKIQKTALNVKTVLATYLKSLLYLQDDGDIFSIRDWILNDNSNSCLFISSDGRKHPTLRPLISAWLNTATKELLGLAPSDTRRIWVSLDEITSLHALSFLGPVQAEGRKFGGCFVLGHHGASQVRTIYGNDGANALSGLCSTRFFLRLPEEADAEPASLNLCTSEVEEVNESVSYGTNTLRDGISVSKQTKEKRIVLASEIQILDDMQGYLRVRGSFPAAKVSIKPVVYPSIHPEFIARNLDPDPLRQKVEKLVDKYSDPMLAAAHDKALEEATKTQEETTKPPIKKSKRLQRETPEFL